MSTNNAAEALRQIKARIDNAPKGPWSWETTNDGLLYIEMPDTPRLVIGDMEDVDKADMDLAYFLADSRTDIEALVDVAEAALELDEKFIGVVGGRREIVADIMRLATNLHLALEQLGQRAAKGENQWKD